MINIGGGPAFILGVAMVLAGVALYALRSMRPELSRDHDIFFAAIALTTGAILMWQGWRLDPFLFLGYLCAAGSAAFFGVENIRLRGITTEQAKRNTPITDKGRSVSRRYDYEPQDYDYDQDYDYRPGRRLPSREDRDGRRIRATRDRYPEETRRLRRPDDYSEDYRDDYDDRYDAAYPGDRYAQLPEPPVEAPPRKRRLPRNRRAPERMAPEREAPTRARPERVAVQDDWDAADIPTENMTRPAPPPRPDDRLDDAPAPTTTASGSRRRPLNIKPAPEGFGTPYGDEPPATTSQYADYRPVNDDDAGDDETDNSDYQQLY